MNILETGSQLILTLLGLFVLYRFIRAIRFVPTREAYIVERLGKYHKTAEAGLLVLLPFIDKVAYQLSLKEETITVDPQECFTKDNVRVEVDGVIYISVMDPFNAAYGITQYRFAAIQLAQTTIRSVIGLLELDQTFEERDIINARVLDVLNDVEKVWGIKVFRYEVKNIVPPQTVSDAMERQMTADRESRAVLARSEGRKQSLINEAEGIKGEMINRSEGEKQKKINEAEGLAEEIRGIALATAESITRIGKAVNSKAGEEAMRLNVSEKYLKTVSKLADDDTEIVVQADLTDMNSLLNRFFADSEKK